MEANMSKTNSIATLATVIALALGAPAFAAGNNVSADQLRAEKIIGSSVYDRDNQDVASVKDLILDRNGKVADVVLTYGATVGIGGKYVAVSFSDLKFDNNRWTIDKTKDQLNAMPPYKIEESSTGPSETTAPPTGGSGGQN
jgi:sporulation protein YlmC with PRC-barrel domain